MKKTSFIIVIIIVVVSAISIHLITSPKVLGNMSKSYSEQITTTSDISFSGEAGDRIKFSFKSDITPELEHRKSGYVERKRRPYQGNVVRIA